MTMKTDAPAPQWWPTTWGALRPGDEILAPDGNAWLVGDSIVSDGAGEWRILRDGRDVWTPHREDEPVQARRPVVVWDEMPPKIPAHLYMAFPAIEEVSAVDRPGAGRWSACGRKVCTCGDWRR